MDSSSIITVYSVFKEQLKESQEKNNDQKKTYTKICLKYDLIACNS